MHDLMNELATFVAGEFFLRFDTHMNMGNKPLEKYHHMSIVCDTHVAYQPFEHFKRAKSLRTFLGLPVNPVGRFEFLYFSSKIWVDVIPELRLLRVLSLSHFNIQEVPEFIGDLKHLRYLNFSNTSIPEIPENVCNLYNLQTLIVFGCKSLIKLPKSFAKLRKLRHFDIRRTPLEKMPFAIGKLESLRTLSRIIIGGDDDFAISELKGLKNLHGKISIEGLHNVKSARQAREASLSLKRPTELELKWGDGSQTETIEKEVLNELKPRSDDLKVLTFWGYGGTEFPSWVGDPSFLQLVQVGIDGCRNCTSLPPLGQLPSLKKLYIRGMDEVKVIGPEFFGTTDVPFRSLEILVIIGMSRWKEWSSNKEVVFPRLQELHISECPNLIGVSVGVLSSLRSLTLYRCGVGVLSLVRASSSTTKLCRIESISGLTDTVWRDVARYLGAVEKLSIRSCDEISSLCESEVEASKVFMNLKELRLSSCSKLVSLGEKEGAEEDNKGSNLLSSLRILEVFSCDQMERCYCPNNIENLRFSSCSSLSLVSFPGELKALTIRGCSQVKNINHTSMPMLESLDLQGFADLQSVTQLSELSNLTDLRLEDIGSIESFGVWPPKLRVLMIIGLKKPVSEWGPQNFPPSLVHLGIVGGDLSHFRGRSDLLPPSLTTLWIYEFDKLESLSVGLQHLTSLQHLIIRRCPKMIHLPETLLPSLLSLKIYDSPELRKRCEGRGSHYWPLISHIPEFTCK